MQQLASQRFVQALYGVLRAAVRALQWDAAVGERRTDLHDRPSVTRTHVLQRGHCGVDVAEVTDLGYAPVLVRRDLLERREHRGERDVHPHVDLADLGLHAFRRGEDLVRIGYIDRNDERSSAGALDVACRAGQPCLATRDQDDGVPRAPNATADARPIPALAPVTTTMRDM